MKWTTKTPWTDEQLSAIVCESGKGDIIVSAAAGSGKTTVLVERIIKNIIEQKTSMDRLLVVTFTEAAAAEMRERIIDSLKAKREEIKGDPKVSAADINYLDEQIFLSDTADIMTIDAFCNRVVSNNYHALGIDPNIRIADHATLEMLRDNSIEKLFNEMYVEIYEDKSDNRERTEHFKRLIECYGTDRDDNMLGKTIKDIHKFAVSFKNVDEWLERAAELCRGNEYRNCKLNEIKKTAERYKEVLVKYKSEFSEYSPAEDDFKNYDKITDILVLLVSILDELSSVTDFSGIKELYNDSFAGKRWAKFTTVSQKIKDEEFLRLYGSKIESAEKIKESVKTLCSVTEDGALLSDAVKQQIGDLVFIVREYIKIYESEKEKLSVLEFSDIEHKTYDLFAADEGVREFYKNKYDEILIDEYQDTNELQDSLFEIISHKNRFMVGDLKQSIYRFRGGDPYIFKKKAEDYAKPDNENIKFVLSQNFRSRQEILRGVNDIFCKVMSEEVGDTDYTKEQLCRLTANKEYCEDENCTEIKPEYMPEMHYLYYKNGENSDKNKKDYQVEFIADKIKELLESGAEVYDKKLKGKRPLMNKDIVILERSVRDNGADLVTALGERGIDAYVKTASYFKCREIVVMMSLINIINNSLQDIPFITVMRSPIWGFPDNELVQLKYNYPRSNMVLSVRACARAEETELGKRCRRAVSQLDRWRQYTRRKSVAQLIWAIYEETGFFDIMGAIDEGEEAQFNLKILYEKAYEYEKTGFKGLADFVRYIEREETHEESMDGISLVGEEQNVVRIMTFHKSKGLEFPYVFVANLGKDFYSGSESAARMHKDFGIGIKAVDIENHVKSTNTAYDVINNRNRLEDISEQLRVLYVALTRAKERLFAVASVEHKADMSEEEIINMLTEKVSAIQWDKYAAADAKGFSDWICGAAALSPQTWRLQLHNMANYEGAEFGAADEKEKAEEKITFDDDEIRRAVDTLLSYKYKYTELADVPSRVSVTRLKERSMTDEQAEAISENEPDMDMGEENTAHIRMETMPVFMREEKLAPNEKGTVYHLIMSNLDFNRIRTEGTEIIDEECKRLAEEGLVSEESMRTVCAENNIRAFFESDIGKRALNSSRVFREEPFQISIPVSEYDPSLDEIFDDNGIKKYKDETIILQGIIDLFFVEEKGNAVLVDYKTDNVANNSIEEIKKRYEVQLELYSDAVKKLTGITVSEKALYLAKSGQITLA